ncbi:LysE family translocator [Pacificimonas sp. WHA3]|uniref:LysE family translocator n=1 Tax=Pacificimonas pallii TaxID=2827236 RepID=A0ABS6SCU9_9SPHN|nr:LysE family translocator [Pacificimonas pallii]MBV7255933.1 LysE family translocator [Pacificimonas pallii]
MTFISATGLFLIMAALAAIPSASVALVVIRSATYGTRDGIAAALGIVAGDLIFAALAIGGLTALAEALGGLFTALRYLAAAYLIWFGANLLHTIRKPADMRGRRAPKGHGGLAVSFMAGLLLTLGDVKAILFYAAMFPAFVDIPAMTTPDIALVAVITVIAIGWVKITYAFAGAKIARLSIRMPFGSAARAIGGGSMIAAGGYLLIKS